MHEHGICTGQTDRLDRDRDRGLVGWMQHGVAGMAHRAGGWCGMLCSLLKQRQLLLPTFFYACPPTPSQPSLPTPLLFVLAHPSHISLLPAITSHPHFPNIWAGPKLPFFTTGLPAPPLGFPSPSSLFRPFYMSLVSQGHATFELPSVHSTSVGVRCCFVCGGACAFPSWKVYCVYSCFLSLPFPYMYYRIGTHIPSMHYLHMFVSSLCV